MPPFGRNRILTEQEINAIVDFLQTLMTPFSETSPWTSTDSSATRRLILKGAGSVALIGLGFGMSPALAAANDKYPEDAFKQKSDADAIKALYGKTAEASDKVKLDAPEIAENGAVVPIAVTTTLADVTSISFSASARTRTRWRHPMSFLPARCLPSPTG